MDQPSRLHGLADPADNARMWQGAEGLGGVQPQTPGLKKHVRQKDIPLAEWLACHTQLTLKKGRKFFFCYKRIFLVNRVISITKPLSPLPKPLATPSDGALLFISSLSFLFFLCFFSSFFLFVFLPNSNAA